MRQSLDMSELMPSSSHHKARYPRTITGGLSLVLLQFRQSTHQPPSRQLAQDFCERNSHSRVEPKGAYYRPSLWLKVCSVIPRIAST